MKLGLAAIVPLAAFLSLLTGCGSESPDASVVPAATTAVRTDTAATQPSPAVQPSEASIASSSLPPPESDAEAQLRMSIGSNGSPHISQPDLVLGPYLDAGLIAAKPSLSADYNRYYRLREPVRFIGYPLAAFETEDMREAGWIGCCLNAGLAILVRTEGRDAAAQTFASENRCRLLGPDDWQLDHLLELAIPELKADEPNYRLISCHDNDASEKET